MDENPFRGAGILHRFGSHMNGKLVVHCRCQLRHTFPMQHASMNLRYSCKHLIRSRQDLAGSRRSSRPDRIQQDPLS